MMLGLKAKIVGPDRDPKSLALYLLAPLTLLSVDNVT